MLELIDINGDHLVNVSGQEDRAAGEEASSYKYREASRFALRVAKMLPRVTIRLCQRLIFVRFLITY